MRRPKVIDTMSARHPWKRRGVSNRRPAPLVVRSIDDTRLEVWEERDRAHVALLRTKDDRTSAYDYALNVAGSLKERR